MKLEILHARTAAAMPAERPPLLFIHGSFCGAWVWAEHLLPYFARHGYDARAVSLRGHGGSGGHEHLAEAGLHDFVDDAVAAWQDFDRPPVVIGHSMGGAVAQFLATRRKVAGLVLLSAVPPSGLGTSMWHMSNLATDLLWQVGVLQAFGPQAVDPTAVHRAIFAADTPPEIGRAYWPKLQDESRRVGLDLMGWILPPLPRPLPPVLVAGGDADMFLPVTAFRETAAYWQGDLEILPGVPHGVMLDPCWPRVAEVLLSWLRTRYI